MNYVHGRKKENTNFLFVLCLSLELFVLFVTPHIVSAHLISRQLEVGMRGMDITAVQEFLSLDTEIYPEGLVTGYFGQFTKDAVSRFQTKYNLESVGRVGPLTLDLLQNVMSSAGSDRAELVLMTETVRTTNSMATFTWYTNEPAFARVTYGTRWPFIQMGTINADAIGGLSTYQTVTIADLAPNSTYYYTLHSFDLFGNSAETVGKKFSTSNEI